MSDISLFSNVTIVPLVCEAWCLKKSTFHAPISPYTKPIADDASNCTFADKLSWWNWIFGTYCNQPRGGHEGMTIGIGLFREISAWFLKRLRTQWPPEPQDKL
jgi:hypothetical protein